MTNTFLTSLVAEANPETLNALHLVKQAGPIVQVVMSLLVAASIVCWTIIFWKWWFLRNALTTNSRFADNFWASGSLEAASKASRSSPTAPLNRVFEAGLNEFNQIRSLKLGRDETIELMESNLARSLDKATNVEVDNMKAWLAFLASTASTAPFVGLFGTVWGIMTSFINIGATGASNLAVVAPGIAEALIATAIGLFAAIPAVLAYNYFVNVIRGIEGNMHNFSSDFLNTAKRNI